MLGQPYLSWMTLWIGDGLTFSSPSIMVITYILNLSLISSIWELEKHKKKKKKTKLSITTEFVNVHLI